MTTQPDDGGQIRSRLQKLGLSELESRVYVNLLTGAKDNQGLAEALEIPPREVTVALTGLAKRGFVRRLPGKRPIYGLNPPDQAISPLVRNLDKDMRELKRLSNELTDLHQRAGPDIRQGLEAHYVEVVFGTESVVSRVDEEVASAEREVVAFSKSPILGPGNPGEEQTLAKGVRHRAIYESRSLEDPETLHAALRFGAEGEEGRVITSLPSKLAIIDERVAIMMVTEVIAGEPVVAAVIARHPEVVDTLYMLFETLWKEAMPLALDPDSTQVMDQERQRLISCLLAGMTDEVIAQQLGVSRRTVTRWTGELVAELGVETRLQAGFKLAEARYAEKPQKSEP